MTAVSVPLIVLSSIQDDVELINRVLRESGLAAQCHWLNSLEQLTETIHITDAQLLWLFCDRFHHDIRTVATLRAKTQNSLPLIAVSDHISEELAAQALCDGAHDLISTTHSERVRSVAERELRTYRLERALNTSLHSARKYQEQLQSFMQGSDDAIAHVIEGILIDANPVWAELFQRESDDMVGPLMDLFDANSHAAIKGALVASQKGQWSAEPLRVHAIAGTGEKVPLELTLEAALFDSEPAVKLSILRNKAEPERPEEIVSRAISTDPSTGFYHRRRLVDAIAARLASAANSGMRALAIIRPDKFGEIAQSVGTLASEEVIVQLADLVRNSIHGQDIYGRFGGTVFALWIERGTLRDIEAWAENLLTSIADNIFDADKRTVSLTCTIGLADAGPNADDLSELLSSAQRANERGRQRGGNQSVLEETSDQSTRVQRFDELWIQQIKNALVENRFQLARLSIASLHGETKDLFDTVVKMIDVQGEEVPASTFLPVAERNRLLRAVDRWVVDAAAKTVAEHPCDRLFVKLSGESIVDPDFLPWVIRCMQAMKVESKHLCFQVSEEAVTQNIKHAMSISQQLRERGFGFAVEHFGIGRDPERLLRQLSMDFVKLDGSLMQGLGSSQVNQDKVRQLITAANGAGIATIAERVEEANTMAVLFQLGIGYVQGHYVHEPEVILEDAV